MGLQNNSSQRYILRIVCVCTFVIGTMLSVFLPTTQAGPEGAQVVHGDVSFSQSGNTTSITASDKSIINYSSFDIAKPEIVEFIQPSSQASVLNRINSATPTNIEGTLRANGRVFFVNPAGVYIGEGAQINVNQLVASGLNISNADFISGRMNFAGGNGTVSNRGDILAEKVYLVGKHVVNSGNINCPGGYVVMAAGERVFLREQDSNILVEFDPPTSPESAVLQEPGPGVLNEGKVTAKGGSIILAAGDIFSQAVSNVGSLSASVEVGDGGQIRVTGSGQVNNTGTIEAMSHEAQGGTITLEADQVINSGTIDVTGSEGGHVVMEATGRLGQFGAIHADGTSADGGDINLHAEDVVAMSAESLTTANAGTNGDGGKVTVYSTDTALFWPDARIEAIGGDESGDGGLVEVSGDSHVEINGEVDASASNGSAGTFKVDPTDITVVDTVDFEKPSLIDPGGDPRVFVPTNDENEITDDVIEGLLSSGTSVTLDTTSGFDGPGGGDIVVAAPIDFSDFRGDDIMPVEAPDTFSSADGDGVTLTLMAADDIDIRPRTGIDGSSLSYKLNVVLQANHAGSGNDPDQTYGDVKVHAPVITNGGSFNSSGVNFNSRDGPINTAGGAVSIEHTGEAWVGIISGQSIVISSNDKLVIAGDKITATDKIKLRSGLDGRGNLSFEPGATLACKDIELRAGDGLDRDSVDIDWENCIIKPDWIDWPGVGGTEAKIDFKDMRISEENTSLMIWQDGPIIETPEHTQFEAGVADIELYLRSDDGSITSNNAHGWKSITAAALSDITLKGSDNIATDVLKSIMGNISVRSTDGNLILTGKVDAYWREDYPDDKFSLPGLYMGESLKCVPGGGVEIIAEKGGIYSSSDHAPLNVWILGYSDDVTHRFTSSEGEEHENGGIGVLLPGGTGRAAIIISSHESLNIGEEADLEVSDSARFKATEEVGDGGVDDRIGVDFLSDPTRPDVSGDPIDVSIYIDSEEGDVTVGAKNTGIFPGGTLVISARDTVNFGNVLGKDIVGSWISGLIERLEVCSRITHTLKEAALFERLPGAKELFAGRIPDWIVKAASELGVPPHELRSWNVPTYAYVLRGGSPAEVLAKVLVRPGISPSVLFPPTTELEQPVPSPPEYEIPEMQLPIQVIRGGSYIKRSELAPGMALGHDDTIKTDSHTRGFIEFADGSEIVMEPNTRITIESPSIFIWFGRITARIRGRFKVRTKYVTAGVKGTKFSVQVDEDGESAIIDMIEDIVSVDPNDDHWESILVESGKQAVIRGREKPEVNSIMEPEYDVLFDYTNMLERIHWEKVKVIPTDDVPSQKADARLYF